MVRIDGKQQNIGMSVPVCIRIILCLSDEQAEEEVHQDERSCLTSSSSVVPAVGNDAPFLHPSVAGSVAKAFAIVDPSLAFVAVDQQAAVLADAALPYLSLALTSAPPPVPLAFSSFRPPPSSFFHTLLSKCFQSASRTEIRSNLTC